MITPRRKSQIDEWQDTGSVPAWIVLSQSLSRLMCVVLILQGNSGNNHKDTTIPGVGRGTRLYSLSLGVVWGPD